MLESIKLSASVVRPVVVCLWTAMRIIAGTSLLLVGSCMVIDRSTEKYFCFLAPHGSIGNNVTYRYVKYRSQQIRYTYRFFNEILIS